MSKIRLTDITLRSLKADRQTLFIDESLPNFGVRVSAKGTKTFTVVLPDRTYKAIGRYPAVSLREARQEARSLLAAPQAKKRSMSLTEAKRAYLEDCYARLRRSTADRYAFALRAEPTNTTELKCWKTFYTWAVRRGYLDHNPYQYSPVSFAERERLLTDKEIAAIWEYEQQPYSSLVKLLILTGQRRGQIAQFQPEWLHGDVITFPASAMKTKRVHSIPATPQVQTLLSQLRPMNSWSKSKVKLDATVGFSDWVLHDIRRYFSTTMAQMGVPLHITEHIIDHRSQLTGVAAIYNRYNFLPEMRESLLRFEHHIGTLLAPRWKKP